MTSVIQTATRVEDLLRIDDPAIPYRFGEIFAGGGWGAERRARERLRLMKELEGALAAMLGKDEVVLFLCRANRYDALEFFIKGAWASLLNRRAVVATNERILLLEIDRRGRLRALGSQVRREAIQRVKGGRGSLRLVFRNGGSLRLTQIPSGDGKRLREIIGSEVDPTASVRSPAQGLEHLCPHCRAVVQGFPGSCPHCRGAFKSASRAGWLAFALPGLGEWYLGYRVFGGFEALASLLVWTALLSSFLVRGEPVAVAVGALLVVGHGIRGLATGIAARKGIYPA